MAESTLQNNEQDPITGRKLPRLGNYNGQDPIDPPKRTLPKLGGYKAPSILSSSDIGSTGDLTLVDFTASNYDNPGGTFVEDLNNLEDIRATNQSTLRALGNTVPKFLGKTATNVIGGIVGTVYGVGSAIANGEASKLWDNALMDKLEGLDKGIDNLFKVYKNADYEEQNILQRALLHPTQFTSDATDALSFTAGAIISEYITAGLASGVVLPKALKYMKALSRGAEAAEATAQLTSAGNKIAKGLVDGSRLTRQLAVGAAYESAVESRQATMELREVLNRQWEEENPGIPMSEEAKAEMDDKLSKAGLFSYLSNLTLVGSSNMMQFPKIFGIGNKLAKAADGSIIKNASTGAYESTLKELGIGGKILRGLKNPLQEGLYEEGLQGVVSGTTVDFWSRKNDESSKGTVDKFLNAFSKNLIETYTTQEGWNEIGMGMLIGGLGAPGRGALSILGKDSKLGKYAYEDQFNELGEKIGVTRKEVWAGGILSGIEEYNTERDQIAKVVEDLNKYTNLQTAMKVNYDFLVQNDNLEKNKERALKNNNVFEFENAKDDQIHAYVSSRIKSGLFEDLTDEIGKMREMSNDEFYASFRGTEGVEQVNDREKKIFKESTIDEFLKKSNNTKEAFDIANDVYQGNNEDLREELIHSIAAAKNLDVREQSINRSLADLSNGMITNLNLRISNTKTINDRIIELNKLDTKDFSEDRKKDIQEELKSLKEAPNKELTLNDHNGLVNLNETDPITFTVNKNNLLSLLEDSRRLRNKRQDYISLFNALFTEEGQIQFEKYHNEEAEKKAKQDIADLKAEEDKEVKRRQKEIKVKVDKAKTEDTTFQEAPMPTLLDESEISLREAVLDPIEEENEVTDIESILNEEESVTVEEKAVAKIVEQEEVNNQEKSLNENGLVKPIQNSIERNNSLELDNNTLQRTVGNTIISLNVDYIENVLGNTNTKRNVYSIFDTYDDYGNLIINDNFDSRLQDPNQFSEGDEITMIVPTFAEMKSKGLKGYTESDYNNFENNVDMFPIAFTDNTGKIIGYLPTQENVRKRVSADNVEVELINNKNLRQLIFDNRNKKYTIKITKKSNGSLLANQVTKNLFDALGDGSKLANDVELAIFKSNSVQTSLNTKSNKKLINKKDLENGIVYAILPTANKGSYVATSLDISKVGEANARSVLKMIQLYKASDRNALDSDLIAERNELSREVDLSNNTQLDEAINSILYKSTTDDTYLLTLGKNKLSLGVTPDLNFTWDSVKYDLTTQERIVSILANRYHAVQLSNFGKNFNQYKVGEDGKLAQIRHKNYMDYLNVEGVVKTNLQGFKIANKANEFYFTGQSVIEFSSPIETGINSEVEEAEVVNNLQIERTVSPEVEPIEEAQIPDARDLERDRINSITDPELRKANVKVNQNRKSLDKGLERIEVLLTNGVPINEKNATELLNEIHRFRKNAPRGATQEELDKMDRLEQYVKDNFNLEIVNVKIGTTHNQGNLVDIVNITSGTANADNVLKDKHGDIIGVYSNIIRPQINKNGVIHQVGQYDLKQEVSKEDVDNIKNTIKEPTANTSSIVEVNPIEEKEYGISESTISAKPKNKLGVKYKPKNRLKIDEDFSFVSRLDNITDLDKKAEELMNKCKG